MHMRKRKGLSIGDLAPLAIMLVIAAIAVAMGAQILDDMQDDFTTYSYAYNTTEEGLESMETFSDWLSLIALIIAAAIIIGILVTYLSGMGGTANEGGR